MEVIHEKQILLISMVKYHIAMFASQSITEQKTVLTICKMRTKNLLSYKKEKNVFLEKNLKNEKNFLGGTLNFILKSLCDDNRKKIQEFKLNSEFKFGDEKIAASVGCTNSMYYYW